MKAQKHIIMVDVTQYHPQPLGKGCRPFKRGQAIFQGLMQAWHITQAHFRRRHEPQVQQKLDRQGHLYWQAYDPKTGQHFSSGSQAEVLYWLEQYYLRAKH